MKLIMMFVLYFKISLNPDEWLSTMKRAMKEGKWDPRKHGEVYWVNVLSALWIEVIPVAMSDTPLEILMVFHNEN